MVKFWEQEWPLVDHRNASGLGLKKTPSAHEASTA